MGQEGFIKRDKAKSGNDLNNINALHTAFKRQKAAFLAHMYPSFEERKANLEALCGMMISNRERIRKALVEDFKVHHGLATDLLETLEVVDRAVYFMTNLEKWMSDEVRESDPNLWGNGKAFMRYQPKGVIGNMVPWNYPIDIAFGPLVDMLSAGNRVIIKPSDLGPACSEAMRAMISETFDPDVVTVVSGGIELARAFATLRWDHLMYTGSTAIGREVMKAAAENLVPVTLELGGKSPVIINDDAVDMNSVTQVIGTKTNKNGQLCISADYCLVPRKRMGDFVKLAKQYVHNHIPNYSRTEHCTGIINEHHFDRLLNMLNQARDEGCQIVELEENGIVDRVTRKMPIFLVLDPSDDLDIMKEEIFGPIVPVKPYDTIDEAIAYVNAGERPLSLYIFSREQAPIDRVITETTSGGVSVNCCTIHGALPSLGFGGSGMSGMGYHHGIEGFREFSKLRGIFVRGDQPDFTELTFAPYGEKLAEFIDPWFG